MFRTCTVEYNSNYWPIWNESRMNHKQFLVTKDTSKSQNNLPHTINTQSPKIPLRGETHKSTQIKVQYN